MEDESHGHGSNGASGASPESPMCLKNNSSSSNKEQDRFLPIANVGRIMKKVLPGNGKISKDAKETVQECVSEFISFVTGEASDKCQREKRKTINGDDIIWAITTLGFEDYVSPLQLYLNKYREIEGEKLNVPKQQRVPHHLSSEPQDQNLSYNTNTNTNTIYNSSSSTNLISHPSFIPTHHHDHPFSLPSFSSSNSIPKQPPQQEQIDSAGHW
ncbi:nuclear transcription factor Y subunit B-1 [Malania oleifera]|uniref:nuclear transcription factor Y subunit B-1 n=1 Tax=Malania oleifera TaxID=397392 RepID=UPI0025AE8C4E|nr:nuclear transcription factor Y subunit B-1 [Malania oleifera]